MPSDLCCGSLAPVESCFLHLHQHVVWFISEKLFCRWHSFVCFLYLSSNSMKAVTNLAEVLLYIWNGCSVFCVFFFQMFKPSPTGVQVASLGVFDYRAECAKPPAFVPKLSLLWMFFKAEFVWRPSLSWSSYSCVCEWRQNKMPEI